jgi:hypothetical protein
MFGALIKQNDLIKSHCMNHRVELAFHDAVLSTNSVTLSHVHGYSLCILFQIIKKVQIAPCCIRGTG